MFGEIKELSLQSVEVFVNSTKLASRCLEKMKMPPMAIELATDPNWSCSIESSQKSEVVNETKFSLKNILFNTCLFSKIGSPSD